MRVTVENRGPKDGHRPARHVVVASIGKIGRGTRCHGSVAMSDCVGPGVAARIMADVIVAMYWKFDAVFMTIV